MLHITQVSLFVFLIFLNSSNVNKWVMDEGIKLFMDIDGNWDTEVHKAAFGILLVIFLKTNCEAAVKLNSDNWFILAANILQWMYFPRNDL